MRILLLTVMLLTPAAADEPAPAPPLTDPFYGMQNPKKMLRGAALTEGQMADILLYRKATTWEREKQIAKERDSLWRKFEEMYTSGATLNVAEATSLAEKATQLSREEEMLKYKVMLKMRSVLTPEQLKRVTETHTKMHDLDAQKTAFEPTVAAERGR